MNHLFENFPKNDSPNLLNKSKNYQSTNNISTDSFIPNGNNNNNYYNLFLSQGISLYNEKSNYVYLTFKKNMPQLFQNQSSQLENLNIKTKKDKINSNKKNSFDSSKENKNNKNIKKVDELNIKESDKNPKIIDTCSEVKKFKTELCHSWELIGTCKYGQNVIIFLLIFIIIL